MYLICSCGKKVFSSPTTHEHIPYPVHFEKMVWKNTPDKAIINLLKFLTRNFRYKQTVILFRPPLCKLKDQDDISEAAAQEKCLQCCMGYQNGSQPTPWHEPKAAFRILHCGEDKKLELLSPMSISDITFQVTLWDLVMNRMGQSCLNNARSLCILKGLQTQCQNTSHSQVQRNTRPLLRTLEKQVKLSYSWYIKQVTNMPCDLLVANPFSRLPFLAFIFQHVLRKQVFVLIFL